MHISSYERGMPRESERAISRGAPGPLARRGALHATIEDVGSIIGKKAQGVKNKVLDQRRLAFVSSRGVTH